MINLPRNRFRNPRIHSTQPPSQRHLDPKTTGTFSGWWSTANAACSTEASVDSGSCHLIRLGCGRGPWRREFTAASAAGNAGKRVNPEAAGGRERSASSGDGQTGFTRRCASTAPKPPGLNIPSATIPPLARERRRRSQLRLRLLVPSRKGDSEGPAERCGFEAITAGISPLAEETWCVRRCGSGLEVGFDEFQSLWRLKFKLSLPWASVLACWPCLLRWLRWRSSSG